jgi:hypothetical protein
MAPNGQRTLGASAATGRGRATALRKWVVVRCPAVVARLGRRANETRRSLKEDRCWPGSETRPGAQHRRHFNPAQAAIEALDEGILLWWQERFGTIGPEEAAADVQCVTNPFSSVARTKLPRAFCLASAFELCLEGVRATTTHEQVCDSFALIRKSFQR